MKRFKRPFFYGWVVVGAGFVAQFITGLAFQGFSSYLIPLGHEFGWNRATPVRPPLAEPGGGRAARSGQRLAGR